MDYRRHYNLLIDRAKNRTLSGYVESHHILPRCMNGDDNPDNLVDLTAEEHYLAHQLLVKIYPGNQSLIFAAHRMANGPHGRTSLRLYGWLRRKHAKAMSLFKTGKPSPLKGRKNPAISDAKRGVTRGPLSNEWKANLSKSKKGKSSHWKGKKNPNITRTQLGKPKPSVSLAKKEKRMAWTCRPVEINGTRYESIKDAAEYYKVSGHTIRDWCKAGQNGAKRLKIDK